LPLVYSGRNASEYECYSVFHGEIFTKGFKVHILGTFCLIRKWERVIVLSS